MEGRRRRRRARNRWCYACGQTRRALPITVTPQDKIVVVYDDKEDNIYVCIKCNKGAYSFKEDFIVWQQEEEVHGRNY